MKTGLRKTLALLLALLLLGACAFAEEDIAAGEETAAEDTQAYWVDYDYDELYTGNPTPFRGMFFTSMWGGNTSDMDIQSLIHGCSPVIWDNGLGRYRINHRIVNGAVVRDDREGNRTYHLELKEDLRYSDGTAITAWDYAFSLLFRMDPAIAQTGGIPDIPDYIDGVEEYLKGEARGVRGIRVYDDYRLDITVRAEELPYFYELSRLDILPYPRHIITPDNRILDEGEGACFSPALTADTVRKYVLDSYSGYLRHPSVCAGPYILAEYDGRTARFVMNPNFCGTEDGHMPRIRNLYFRSVDNENMIRELGDGEFGLLNKVTYTGAILNGIRLQELQQHQYTMTTYPRNGLMLVKLVPESEPLQDPAVRKALTLCMDRDEIIRLYVGPYGMAVNGLFGIGQWTFQMLNSGSYPQSRAAEGEEGLTEEETEQWTALSEALQALDSYELDPEEAARLLAESGWTLNEDGEAFRPGVDEARCKKRPDGSLMTLRLQAAIPEQSEMRYALEEEWVPHLQEAGIQLTMTSVGMAALEDAYDGGTDPFYDLVAVGENFSPAYNPTPFFTLSEKEQADRAALIERYRQMEEAAEAARAAEQAAETEEPAEDEAAAEDEEDQAAEETVPQEPDGLYAAYEHAAELADQAIRTRNSDLLTYATRWVALQQSINEDIPVIPIYSNVYFDFYTRELHDYDISGKTTWGETMAEASMYTAASLEAWETERIEAELSEMEELFDQLEQARVRRMNREAAPQ